LGREPVAGHGLGTAAQDGREVAAARGHRVVADRVDTAMDAMKVEGLDRTVNRAPRHLAFQQLPNGDYPVLPRRQASDYLLHRVWAVFSTVFVDKSAHTPMVAVRVLQRTACL
jgi:hypothetical protein